MVVEAHNVIGFFYDATRVPDLFGVQISSGSANSENLVGLNAQPPARVRHTVVDGKSRVLVDARPIHRLEKKMIELELLEFLGRRAPLRVDELELVARLLNQTRTGFRTDADPVYGSWRVSRAIRLDCHTEPTLVEAVNQRLIELQQRLAAGADDKALVIAVAAPRAGNGVGEILSRRESSTVGTRPHEVRIAELTDRARTILFATAPEITTGEAAEHRRAACVRSLALKRIEDFLDGVSQRASPGLDADDPATDA